MKAHASQFDENLSKIGHNEACGLSRDAIERQEASYDVVQVAKQLYDNHVQEQIVGK
jgi:hypothetical protein